MTRAATDAPVVKGWCPGAHRPMMSGDGLVVRVRPFMSQLTPDQMRGLCDLARRYGNGTLDLTSRANLQIRAISEEAYPEVLSGLDALGLLDGDPAIEGHRNVLVAPDWTPVDLTDRLYSALFQALPGLPDLPEKMGYALDTGVSAVLGSGSADFRFELDTDSGLMLRADGAAKGRWVDEADAMSALWDLADWFARTGGRDAGRMARHLRGTDLPAEWQRVAPRPQAAPFTPGPRADGLILGAPFGSMQADALEAAIDLPGVHEMRVMTGRLFWLRGTSANDAPGFIATTGDPVLSAHACPGAPLCPQATVDTRTLARQLAGRVSGSLHVSGCAKGCALPRSADVTLTGRNGRFDLVRNGAPWDEPIATELTSDGVLDLIGTA